MRRRSYALVVFVTLLATAGGARAQEYCVACTEPSAQYRCVIENAQPGGATPLQTLCVTAMSKAGNHAACAIKRGTVFDCSGPVKRVPWVSAIDDIGPPAPPNPDPAKQSDPKAPPRTVEEMADRANKKTAEDMKKAGDNMKEGAQNVGEGVSKATKKTWECLSSFFSKC